MLPAARLLCDLGLLVTRQPSILAQAFAIGYLPYIAAGHRAIEASAEQEIFELVTPVIGGCGLCRH